MVHKHSIGGSNWAFQRYLNIIKANMQWIGRLLIYQKNSLTNPHINLFQYDFNFDS